MMTFEGRCAGDLRTAFLRYCGERGGLDVTAVFQQSASRLRASPSDPHGPAAASLPLAALISSARGVSAASGDLSEARRNALALMGQGARGVQGEVQELLHNRERHLCAVQPSGSPCPALSPLQPVQPGSKWRAEHNLSRSGTEYGPLTDLPDWSFADGRPAPPLKGQERRKRDREEFARRVVLLSSEVDRGMQRWRERKEEGKAKDEKKRSLLLKPKGNLALKDKK
ncbi:hypothetical protein AAFF_G00277590 [Aldrovandia affinis]|uniref:Large ribosomal subunit protein mL52 n=1 Tax=Aldrovandia affinis TaxID=143900 RepID=A0AAD7W1A7_9TELE|nr:hypothetical protein AAFF_G00277590 [Aldrovandia affinis]